MCARDLLSPTGDLSASPVPGLLPFRPERDYLDAADSHLRLGTDPMAALQLGLDPRVRADLRSRLEGADRAGAPGPGADVSAYDALLAAGHDVWVVDLTPPEVAAAGWTCARVLVPGLRRIPVPAFPGSIDAAVFPGW